MAQGEYTSEFTGTQIDALLKKVDQRVSTPAPAEDKLITSGGVYTGLAGKTDKVTSPTVGNLPKLKADGSLEDSGKKPSDFVEKEAGKGLSTNDYTDTEKAKLGALPTNADLQTALGNKEDKSNKVTSFSSPTDTQYPSAKLVSDSLDAVKADVSSLLTKAGIAEGIADTISAGTPQEFLQRPSGGDGVNCLKRIKGKTIAWNQLVQNGNFADTSRWTTSNVTITVSNNIGSITATRDGDNYVRQTIPMVVGHKYLFTGEVNGATAGGTIFFLFFGTPGTSAGQMSFQQSAANVWEKRTYFFTCSNNSYNEIRLQNAYNGTTNQYRNVKIIDLTLMFGAGNEPSTVAEFEALYPEPYYPYTPGMLKSNDAAALLTVGCNQWDEVWEKGYYGVDGSKGDSAYIIRSVNYTKVLPNQTYYIKIPDTTIYICEYDVDKNFISRALSLSSPGTIVFGATTSYIRFCIGTAGAPVTTYNNDICINLSDASFNGTYEPYWQRVLALRISELTGIPEGGTEADRVTMFPNGLGGAGSAFDSLFVENGVTKARKTMLAEVDLGDLSWSYTGAAMYAPLSSIKDGGDSRTIPLVCSGYEAIYDGRSAADTPDKTIYNRVSPNKGVVVKDSAYTDPATFKAAVAGVKLIAEAATPIVYTDLQYADGTPFTMPATILVDNYGKEVIVPPTGATTPSAPFCCDSNYSISIANLVKKLNTL